MFIICIISHAEFYCTAGVLVSADVEKGGQILRKLGQNFYRRYFCVDMFCGRNPIVFSFLHIIDVTSTELSTPIKLVGKKDIFDHETSVDRNDFLPTIIVIHYNK